MIDAPPHRSRSDRLAELEAVIAEVRAALDQYDSHDHLDLIACVDAVAKAVRP